MPNVGTHRWSEYFRRIFATKGPGAGPDVILTDVMPTLDVFGDSPELYFARGERLFTMGVTQAAGGAGNFSRVGITARPNTMLCITRVSAYQSTSGGILWRVIPDGTGSIVDTGADHAFHLDVRESGVPPFAVGKATPASALTGAAAFAPTTWNDIPGCAGVLFWPAQLVVGSASANVALAAVFHGWWRQLEADEL